MNPILRYIIRRILFMIPLFIGVTSLVFLMVNVIGDPVEMMLAEVPGVSLQQIEMVKKFFGTDKPVALRYFYWLGNMLRFDLGTSIYKGRPVLFLLSVHGAQTLKLQLTSLTISLFLSIFLGVTAAVNQYTKKDTAIMSLSLFSRSIPGFWLGLMLILIFSNWLKLFPSYGAVSTKELLFGNQFIDELWHMVLPTLMLTFFNIPAFTLLMRSSMVDVLREDYILAARASGLNRRTVIWKHALKNAIMPVIAYASYIFGIMIASSPVTETVFTWPGVGFIFVDAITNLDYPLIMGVIFILVITVFAAGLIADIIYVTIDPRIKLE
ncbi:MAG: ABC transporter permease [Candidatus Bathyarchaeia archaeon]